MHALYFIHNITSVFVYSQGIHDFLFLGESTCRSAFPNARAYEEFDGYDGKPIHSRTKQS